MQATRLIATPFVWKGDLICLFGGGLFQEITAHFHDGLFKV